MFQRPVLNVENIDKGTFVGIEIEICIKRENTNKWDIEIKWKMEALNQLSL